MFIILQNIVADTNYFYPAAYTRLQLKAGTYHINTTIIFGACAQSDSDCEKYDRVEIIGAGEDKTVLDALGSTSHFFVNPGGCLKLTDLTITRGKTFGKNQGGALTMIAYIAPNPPPPLLQAPVRAMILFFQNPTA